MFSTPSGDCYIVYAPSLMSILFIYTVIHFRVGLFSDEASETTERTKRESKRRKDLNKYLTLAEDLFFHILEEDFVVVFL